MISCLKFAGLLILAGAFSACNTTHTTLNNAEENTLSDLEELYWARIDSSRMNFTEADVAFMTGMIGHHAQALIMSRLAPTNDASPQIQILASRIINAQKGEILSMQRWLRNRDLPVPEVHIDGLNLMIHNSGEHTHTDHEKMPGMLTQQQLQELADAEGNEFDHLFLKYMINHHSGAVTMVKKLFSTDGAALDEEAFKLASDIQVDQKTEIARMKLMLKNLSNTL